MDDDVYEKSCGNLPTGYRVVWFAGDEHYHWIYDEQMSEGFCDRFDARRAAIQNAQERADSAA